ncbi:rhomboid family intramembrane serine protease [Mangrovicella endophytica]|uniref:rhomboid family intramembrane serine protease n=1 Tax=Mangrovicella endophytica TaxID=2066697 RepID=UPI001FDFE6A8|nr:rhomboid family intramembrane serine protease [Mangrovicella endophytica]
MPKLKQPPAFNVPGVVLTTIVVFAAIHVLRVLLLTPAADDSVIIEFSFIPGCYAAGVTDCAIRPSGASIWSPVTYAFLHGSWMHLITNTVWLLAFGPPVARRIGDARFLLFCICGAIAGAAAFWAVNPDLLAPVIGASGIVSALMGGACRFAFSSVGRARRGGMITGPLMGIGEALRDRTVLFFILVFFGSNLITGTSFGEFVADGADVAWESHLGGFAFGFLLFRLFDRRFPSGTYAQS